jgi:hypothetical protein
MNKQIIGVLASVVLGGASWLAVYLLERAQ